MYIYLYLNHFAIHLKVSQCCKSTILQLKKKTTVWYITFVDFRILNHSGFGLIHLEFLLLCAEARLACDVLFLYCTCVVLVPKSYWIRRRRWEGNISSFFLFWKSLRLKWSLPCKYLRNCQHKHPGRFKTMKFLGFPGGAVGKSRPANAGDVGSSPGPGRSHMPRSN